ncbi:MAG: GTP-binding protein [Promethearchaeota archaeon]
MRRIRPKHLKIIVAGEGGVGKTTLIETFRHGRFFDKTTMTIAVQFHTMQLSVFDKTYNLQIWDLGGQRHFLNMGVFSQYCRGAHAVLVCFDATDFDTLEEIPSWLEVLAPNVPKILVGTKADMADKEELEDLRAIVEPYLESFKFRGFMLSNVKDLASIQKVFRALVILAIEDRAKEKMTELTPSLVA